MARSTRVAGQAAGGFIARMVGKLIRPARATFKTGQTRTGLRQAAQDNAKRTVKRPGSGQEMPRPDPRKAFRGRARHSGDVDPDADKLARKLGGKPSQKFDNDPLRREFDVISDKYVGSTKNKVTKKWKQSHADQAKDTFEAAINTGRTPYFHYTVKPSQTELDKLAQYAKRYGIEPVIDISPL